MQATTYMQAPSDLPWEQPSDNMGAAGNFQQSWEQPALPWEVSTAFVTKEAGSGKWQGIMAAVYNSIAQPGNPLAPLENWQDDDSSGSELMDGDVPMDDLLSKPIEQACRQAYGAYLFHKKRWRVLSGRRIKKKKGKGFGIGRKHLPSQVQPVRLGS